MFGHRGDGQEVRHLRISGGLDGGFSYWRAFPQGWALQTSPREVDHHPRGSSFCGVCGFCNGVQPAVVTSWCPPQGLQFPAPSSLCSADSSVWRSPCGWSWTKGTSSAGLGHQTSWSYDRLISDTARQKEVKTSTKTSSKKMAPRPSVFDRLGFPPSTTQRTVTQEPPFPAGAGRARPRPFQGSKKCGKSSSSSAAKKRWRVSGGGSPGRLCPTLAESAGQLPGHRHRRGRRGHCIPATTSAHPSKHQFPDQEQPTKPSTGRRCLADKGGHRACHQREVPGFLQSVVSGAQEDRRSATCDRPVHSQPPHGGSTLQDGDARVRLISHQKSGVGRVDRHTQVSAFRGQQEGVPVHLSSVWTGNFSTGVHQAAETRRLAVEAARCEATCLLRRLADQGRYTGRSSTVRPDNHQGPPVSRMDHQLREIRPHTKSRLPVHWDAVQHSTFHSGAPAENASKGPVSSSTLDGQSEHNCQRSAQTSRHAGVHGLAGSTRTAPSLSSPMVDRYSMVPEDRELVRPDSSSTVGSVRGGMVVIPSSPARSTPRRQGDGSDSSQMRPVRVGEPS